MKSKSIILISAASAALGLMGPSIVMAGSMTTKSSTTTTTETTPSSAIEQDAAKVGSNLQKSVGMKDNFTQEEANSVVALSSVDRSNATLQAAKVDDPSGNVIGTVKQVKTDKAGKVASVHIDVGSFLGIGGRVVEVPASRFSYLASRNILITNLTKPEVEAMPPVAQGPATDKAS